MPPSFDGLIEGYRTSSWECADTTVVPLIAWRCYVDNDPYVLACSCISGIVPTVVVAVSTLEWRLPSGNGSCGESGNGALDDCPNNGGARIFPGKLDPNDVQGSTRRQIDLVATIEPPVANVPVYFQVWDVDDPFDQSNSGLANVGLIDNDTIGGDNRPQGQTDPAVVLRTRPTDENGEAHLTLTVSMQPGNNYRAAASVIGDVFGGSEPQVSQADADAKQYDHYGHWSGYEVPAVWSKMLTVWRKLHVETDSMARPAFTENTIVIEWNQPRFPNGVLLLDINDQNNSDQFDNGFIRIQADGFADIVALIITFENPLWGVDDVIHTSITEAVWGDRPDQGQGIISDDDLANEARFTAGIVGSDIGTGNPPGGFLPLPDTSGLTAHYQQAYILPVVESQYTSTTGIAFQRNMSLGSLDWASWDSARAARGLPIAAQEYWAVQVFSAFQGERNRDADSELENTKGASTHPDGSTSPGLLWGSSYPGMATVFKETLRDGYGAVAEQRTVAHEIAHCLGAPHLGSDAPGDGGLMDETEQGPAFLAESLKRLREYAGP